MEEDDDNIVMADAADSGGDVVSDNLEGRGSASGELVARLAVDDKWLEGVWIHSHGFRIFVDDILQVWRVTPAGSRIPIGRLDGHEGSTVLGLWKVVREDRARLHWRHEDRRECTWMRPPDDPRWGGPGVVVVGDGLVSGTVEDLRLPDVGTSAVTPIEDGQDGAPARKRRRRAPITPDSSGDERGGSDESRSDYFHSPRHPGLGEGSTGVG